MTPASEGADVSLREQFSNLHGLLVLSMLMTEGATEDHVVHVTTTSVPSLAPCEDGRIYLLEHGWRPSVAPHRDTAGVEAQLVKLGSAGGRLQVPGKPWAWAYPLRSLAKHFGYLMVAGSEPTPSQRFLLQVLAQQSGVALANARSHARERQTARELAAANAALEASNAALKASIEIHRRLTEVAVSGERLDGIARAVHELTGLPVAIEDRHGNLQAWAGPPPPQPYPKDPLAQRERLLERLRRTKRPVRVSDRILALAQPRYDIIGILALFDPSEMAGEHELVAIEHGATVLAMELARLRSLAEAELRLGRDLVEELLAGTDEESALAHAQALGYDLKRPYHVVVVERGARDGDDELFFHAVRRAAGNLGVGSLLVARARTVVVLADAVDVSWPKLQSAVLTELGGGQCRIGVGGRCDRPADFPRSYREAQLALKMQEISGHDDRVTSFEDLGVYRILSQVQDPGEVERFARQRLERLIEYDEQTGSDLVMTLMTYLACGGSHTRAAQKLNLHRSTLKYRIRRIHEISGHDLGDPEVAFDLALATRAWAILRAIS